MTHGNPPDHPRPPQNPATGNDLLLVLGSLREEEQALLDELESVRRTIDEVRGKVKDMLGQLPAGELARCSDGRAYRLDGTKIQSWPCRNAAELILGPADVAYGRKIVEAIASDLDDVDPDADLRVDAVPPPWAAEAATGQTSPLLPNPGVYLGFAPPKTILGFVLPKAESRSSETTDEERLRPMIDTLANAIRQEIVP